MTLYARLAELPLEIEEVSLERRELPLPRGGFTRVTTTLVLHGAGERGEGEDVTWQAQDHEGFPAGLPLADAHSVGELSRLLDAYELSDYRRWAFESAALDLALRQAGLSLAQALGREPRPVRFVVSQPDVEGWLEIDPSLEFKLDAGKDWDRQRMERLAATGRVRTVDLKAYYHEVVGLRPDPELYRAVAEIFADAVIEDPSLGDDCREALRGAEERLSFDAPIHSLADLEALPVEPRWLNVKPSRFGTLARLLECVEACERRGIRLYGGGRLELGPGRQQVQALAGILYPDAPNDVAPGAYNEGEPRAGLPTSPLPSPEAVGF